MFERFTERARRVIFFARYEASQYGSPYIETEHLLLGLIREDKALTNRFLRQGRSIESIRQEVEAQIITGERIPTSVEVPLTIECKHILNYAAEEANQLKHRHIGTEHLLLAMLREGKCRAAQILQARGVTLIAIREELARAQHRAEEVIRTTTRPADVVTVEPGMESIEIREAVLQLLGACNTQDGKKFASLFHEEGRFVDIHGDLWIGQSDVEKGAARYFSSSERAAIRGKIEDIKCLGTNIAVVTIVWANGAGPQDPNSTKLRMTVVLTETNQGWIVVSAHATEMRPGSPTC